MGNQFTPLASAAAPAPGTTGTSQLRVMTQAEAASVFKPLTTQSTSLSHAPASPGQGSSSHTHQNPIITLKREEDRVTHIKIECVCGQVIELACAY